MSKIALISDVHGNLQALKEVIKVLEKESPDIWICLGDIVGYGPHPSECINLIRGKNMICVLGNHDAGVAGLLNLKHFRNPNQRLIQLTKELLSTEEIDWLKSLPLSVTQDDWLAVHASPIEPEKWKYLDSAFTVRSVLQEIEQKLCFIGHTHKPALVSDSFGVKEFSRGNKFLINPGSVGQSRDGDYRASCSFIDTSRWIYKNLRIEYDTEPVLTSLMKLGFTRSESNHLMKL